MPNWISLWQNARLIGEAFKVWAETFAYRAGGIFLIYKVVSGYFITDLSVDVSCERCREPNSADPNASIIGQLNDLLTVTAVLKKGEKGTIRIHDARVRVTNLEGKKIDEQRMLGIDRVSFNAEKGRMKIAFERLSGSPFLSLPPGDQTKFVALCRVPSGQLSLVEFVILGRKRGRGKPAHSEHLRSHFQS